MTPRELRLVAAGLLAWIAVVLAAGSLPPSPTSVMAGHMLLVLLAAPPLALGLRAAPLPPAAGVVLFSASVLVAALPAVLVLCTRSAEAHAVLDLIVVAGAVALFQPRHGRRLADAGRRRASRRRGHAARLGRPRSVGPRAQLALDARRGAACVARPAS